MTPEKPVKTRVVLVDDHEIVLNGLGLLFSSIENVEVVAQLTESRKVEDCLRAIEADILITDLQMPHLNGIDLIVRLRPMFPNLKFLLLTMSDEAVLIKKAIKAGVHGYMLKRANKEELMKAIGLLKSGKRYYSQEVTEELAGHPVDDLNDRSPSTIQQLTRRELEILKLISEEYSTTEIAERLFISIPTVETHRRNLMVKLQAKNLAGLVKYAVKHGLG